MLPLRFFNATPRISVAKGTASSINKIVGRFYGTRRCRSEAQGSLVLLKRFLIKILIHPALQAAGNSNLNETV
jgi:hypothetical protein